jgi:hypothetical protein
VERILSSLLLSSPPWAFSASLPLLRRPAAKTRANAAGMCSLAAWTGLIRSITLISSATPLSPDHMVLSDRGMALGRWRPTVVADTGGPCLMRRDPPRRPAATTTAALPRPADDAHRQVHISLKFALSLRRLRKHFSIGARFMHVYQALASWCLARRSGLGFHPSYPKRP